MTTYRATVADRMDYLRAQGVGALTTTMGIEFLEFSDERAVARIPVAGNTQPAGLLHGGAFVVLGETLGSRHANLLSGEGRQAFGTEVSASHTRSVADGWVYGTCIPLHVGKGSMVHQILITNDAGQLCCAIRITNAIRSRAQV